VGGATAEAAREAGFTDVRTAEGDVIALGQRIAADRSRPAGEVLHIAPREPAGDLVQALAEAGVPARREVLYEAAPLLPAAEALEAWPALAAALIHSPLAARGLADAAPPRPGPPLLCISENAAAPLRSSYAQVRVAAEPTEAALLALLGKPVRPE
jgi:uroporphyrinogen-III synthase